MGSNQHVRGARRRPGKIHASSELAKRIFRPGGEWGDLWAVRGLKLELMDIYRPAPTPGEPGPVEPGERDIGPPT